MSRRAEFQGRAKRALELHGAKVTSVKQNKHVKIAFETANGAGQFFIATTPSDVRAELNVASDIRRKLAEIAARKRDCKADVRETITQAAITPRTRQAPHPPRSSDYLPAFRNTGGHSGAMLERRKEARLRKRAGHNVSPEDTVRRMFNEIQDKAINGLAKAVEKNHPHWDDILIAAALGGIPYTRSVIDEERRYAIWAERCSEEFKDYHRTAMDEFTNSLSEIARSYADQMPERSQLVRRARKIFIERWHACSSHEWEWPPTYF